MTIPIPEMRKVLSRAHALPSDRTYCLTQAPIPFLRWVLLAFLQAHHFTPTPADADFFTSGSFPGLSQLLSPSSPPLPLFFDSFNTHHSAVDSFLFMPFPQPCPCSFFYAHLAAL